MSTRKEMTAEKQLERILYILPAAARDDGAAIDELARALGVDDRVILRDLEDATTRVFSHPAGTVDSFSILIDGRRVTVHAPAEFRRPVRLNAREALALGLGLRTLAAEAGADARPAILQLAQRLEAALTAPDVIGDAAAPGGGGMQDDVEYDDDSAYALAFEDDGFRGVVADAVELGRMCRLLYLKPGDPAPVHRRVVPYRLVHAEGMWYVAAHDADRDDLRFFRMDRVLNAELDSEPAPPPPDGLDALLRNGAPFIAHDELHVDVRYSPRVARWIVERGAPHEADADGSVLVRHRVADRRWLVRHVMQYGGDAVIEGPPAARGWVRAAAGDIA